MPPAIRQILDMNAFDASRKSGPGNPLLERRLQNFGAASVLFYRSPIEMVRARGAWMVAENGKQYLDFYNNVPSVGHCHPRVVDAISDQVATLNIHTRYLTRVVDDYLDALKATLPGHLDNLLLSCTGSEANDLALRIASTWTGNRGFIVTETAYHGNTLATTDISPAALKKNPLPDHVVAIPPPSPLVFEDGVAQGFAAAMAKAVATLDRRGYGVAALICDSIFSSDGVFSDPAGFLADAVDVVRQAGGLYIADEVQPGFARTGECMWGFQRHAVRPDLVTMGKPMGNGFPMAGVAARAAHMNRFCEDVGYFNTFGGNPVAAAAGQAVLDIIREERLMENALNVGGQIVAGLNTLRASHPVITAVRGCGLFIGTDLCADGDPRRPDQSITTDVINGLKERGVLIGAAGKYGNTLKLRPPLCLTAGEANIFLNALEDTLGQTR
ncbi:aspartate aminotransferase family protein [Desulfosarcina ovata]|uniref:Aspartate aminotransferase family protein n=1 Tax=Desulfosarcina ovata subsp. ovata TaxID=2752305 RepID=A0A5K8AB30_9BACT|nr:aspartate aminotransferase family protein [Desulfosarcina ovata]BBO89719.1 aspartate aminotransferase family protein [Desulfosarcina ovata subsp. ovata]